MAAQWEPRMSWIAERVRAYEPVVSLREYQDEAVTVVAQALEGGKRRVMVVLPTGAGKTVVFGALVWSWLSDDMGRVLVLAHRDELISQAVEKMAKWIPRHLIGVVKAGRNDATSPVVVASVQTLKNERRMAQVGTFGLIVIDEAHHAAAASYRAIVAGLRGFMQDGPYVVGVTATPKRADGVRLDDIFEDIVYAKTYSEMVAAKHLVPCVSKVFDLVEHAGRPRLGIDGDYSEGWLEGVMLKANAPDKIVQAWKDEAYDRPTIVFTPTVSVAKAVAEAFNGDGVSAAWVSGAMPIKDRRAALAGLASGQIRVVANCAVLTEGFDEPSVSCIVVGRPTMNETLYIQMVGRGTRLYPGKSECLVLDMVGCADQLQLDAVVALGGKKPEAKKEPVLELLDAEKKQPRDVPFSTADGVLVARAPRARRPVCRWVDLGEGWKALSMLGEGWIVVRPDNEGTHTVLHWKGSKASVLYERLDADWAMSYGEAGAKAVGGFGPMRWGNPWLDRPLTEKSFTFSKRMGFPVTEETTGWQKTVMEAEQLLPRWRR